MTRRSLATLAAVCLTCLFTTAGASGAPTQAKRWGSYNGSDTQPVPSALTGLENVVAVDAGNASTYALESNGTVWSSGENGRGELGDGLTESLISGAVQVAFPAGVKIVAIGEAQNDGYAIDSTGQGWSWGEVSPSLCLGRGIEESLTPQEVPGLTSAVAVQGGGHHVLWLMKTGTVEVCGVNHNGQLGVSEDIESSPTPITVPGLSSVVEVSSGDLTSCARTSSGAVYDWGDDLFGQVGNGVEEAGVYAPFKVPLPGAASEVSCGGDMIENGHALALVNGAAYGWGDDGAGQLGDGQRTDKTTPALATDLSGLGLTHVVASGAYSLGLNAAGNVYAWGSDYNKALGTGRGTSSQTPMLVDSGADEISGTACNSVDR